MNWQRALKQVALRTGWGTKAFSLFFACHTPVHNGHAHIDPMGFDFTALGRPLVVDPGRFTYHADEDRRRFKSATWHNTLTINDREPFAYLDSWGFGPQGEGDITRVTEQPSLLAVEARQENFSPVIHRRAAILAGEEFLLVLDHLQPLQAGDRVQLYFHLDSTRACWDAARRCAVSEDAAVNVALYASAPLTGTLLAGRVSDFIDCARPSQRLRLSDEDGAAGERCYATVILPYPAGGPCPRVEELHLTADNGTLTCAFLLNGTPRRVRWGDEGIFAENSDR